MPYAGADGATAAVADVKTLASARMPKTRINIEDLPKIPGVSNIRRARAPHEIPILRRSPHPPVRG
jgi:hypothetical protein